jgi:Fe2+ transport system protein FeoA
LSASISLADSAEGAGRVVVREAAVKDPEVESRLLAVGVVPAVRVAVVRVAEAVGVAAVRLAVAVRGVVAVVDGGLRAAVVEPAVPTVRLSAVLAGLDMMELVLRADATEEVVDFLSSSLALMLGRLRWLDMDVAVGGRRMVEAAGRVGGLLRPPGARVVLEVVGLTVEEVAPGRRVAVAAAEPGCLSVGFAPGLSFAFSLTGVSGDEGVAVVLGLSGSGSGSVVAAASD